MLVIVVGLSGRLREGNITVTIKIVSKKTPRGRFELPRREAPVAFEATAFPG